jgi:hypothetical protein
LLQSCIKSLLKPKRCSVGENFQVTFSLCNKSFLCPDHVFSSCCCRQCVVWHTRYNVNVHYCVISYPTLKLSFQERISTLTVQTKGDLIRRMCEKHPQFVFDVLIGSTQEQGGYHPDHRPDKSHHLPGADAHTVGKCQPKQKQCVAIKPHITVILGFKYVISTYTRSWKYTFYSH